MLLAQFGAEVIKVEKSGGDAQRHKLRSQGAAFGPVYRALNRGKQVLKINLEDAADRASFDKLVAGVDIFVTNYRPAALRRLGLDPATMTALRPDLVYVSLTGAGWSDAYADQGLDDGMAQAMSGLMYATGWPGDGPVYCPLPISAVTSGLFGAIAAVSSFYARLQGQKPIPTGIAMLDALAFCQEYAFMHAANMGESPARNGGRHPTGTPSQVYGTKSGSLAIMAPSDREFARLCTALDLGDLVDDERFESMIDRLINRDDLTAIIEKALAADTAWHWFSRLSDQGIACAPVRGLGEVVSDPLARERGLFTQGDADEVPQSMCVAVPDGAVARQGKDLGDPCFLKETKQKWQPRDDRWPSVTGAINQQSLSGVSVVDLTRYLAGPFATTILADLGASVQKIEPPEGDPARGFGPIVKGTSGYFASVNRGKTSRKVDLKTPEGRQILKCALRTADLLVENFRPGTLQRIGIPEMGEQGMSPGAHTVSISGFGQSGTFAHRAAFDMTVQAFCGIMAQTGYDASRPTRLGFSLGDIAAGLFATLSAVCRLVGSKRGQPGGQADIAMADALYCTMESMLIAKTNGAIDDRPGGAHHLDSVPQGAFPTSDGHVYIAAASDLDFITLWGLLDLGRQLRPADFGRLVARRARKDELIQAISARTKAYSSDKLLEVLGDAGLRSAPVLSVKDSLDSAYFRDVGLIVPHPETPHLKVVRTPFVDLTDCTTPSRQSFNAPLQKEIS